MIVELCGVPGAGKSTLARALVSELERRGHHPSLPLEEVSPRRSRRTRLRRKLRRGAVEAILHPGDSQRTIRAVIRSGQPHRSDVLVRSLNWLVLRAALRRSRRAAGVHVFDQGVVQELGSLELLGDARTALGLADPGSASLGPDLLVVLDVEPGTAADRLTRRPGAESRVERQVVDLHRELIRQRDVLNGLVEVWTERFGDRIPTTVVRVDDGGLAELVDLLCLPTAETEPVPA